MCDLIKCSEEIIEAEYKNYKICKPHWEAHFIGDINLNDELGLDT